MLLKANITGIEIHTPEWFQGRLAKFTSSEIYNLMGDKPFTSGALSYIYKKIGEELTGIEARDEVQTTATVHGLTYEVDAIRKFGQDKGLTFVVTQKLISAPDSRFGSTPDFLIVHSESADKTAYNVSTGEVKCPLTYNAFIELFLCETPEDVKKVSKAYYWQCIDQMDNCDALRGFLVIYHPFFRAGGYKVIEFRKVNLVSEFKLLKERKLSALDKFIEIRDKMLQAG